MIAYLTRLIDYSCKRKGKFIIRAVVYLYLKKINHFKLDDNFLIFLLINNNLRKLRN